MKYSFTLVLLLLFNSSIGQEIDETKDTLIVGYAPAAPFIIQEDGLLEGINIWLWRKVADDLELEYTLKQMNFSEMLTAIKSGEIDVSINPLTITGDRSKEMEFTHSFFASHSTIAVAQLSSFQKIKQFVESFFRLNFLRGFLLLFIILLFFGMLAWLFERRGNPEFRKNHKGIWDGLWWSAVTLTTVGYGDKSPKTRGGKIAALGLMLSGLLFVSGLTASIASSLTVNQLANSSDSFNAFKDRKVGTVKSSESRDFLRVHFFKDVIEYEGVVPGLKDLKKGQLDAFIYDEPILQYRMKKDESLKKLEVLPLKFDVQFYAFGIKKDAVELEQAISQRILEILETQEWEVILSEFGLTEL
ncbi:transporter substrate-binding domain-containing protein [Croceivirga thetidis]|uniref:Transporter substrate-binding domain-containing protein n=1 Tax=Croceivirga thetidis TaxID=2721623 RepID=A0ABX1GS29_9FLAO|nr:transporter substrate-binding domain-containing protein [Croceivirga thetidis]NKI32414.1 transporter substrate-binding domain-containing protein [Croceivirga thetidis]